VVGRRFFTAFRMTQDCVQNDTKGGLRMTAALGGYPQTPVVWVGEAQPQTHQTNAMKAIPLFVTVSRRREVNLSL